jgi:RNA polymerase sigma-70 factor (ECF subfamily)
MTTNTDQYYIDKVCAGNTNDYAFLVERYKNMVFTLAIRMVKNREEAEEIAQDAFIKAFRSLSKFKGDSKFSTWLYKITYNSSIDYLKRAKRLIKSDLIDEINEDNLGLEQDVLTLIEYKERKQVIEKALYFLPEDDRIIITLFYFEELSLQEISDIVGVKSNVVKVKLHRSRKKLYELLKDKTEMLNVKNYDGR